MERTGDYLILLFLCELDKVYRIAAYTNGELGILFGMRLGIKKSFARENVYVEVVSTLLNVAVEKGNKVIYLILCS